MSPHITSTFHDFFNAPNEKEEEETKKKDNSDLQLKDVDEEFRNQVMGKIEALYKKLKEESSESKYSTLFQVDETVDRMELEVE